MWRSGIQVSLFLRVFSVKWRMGVTVCLKLKSLHWTIRSKPVKSILFCSPVHLVESRADEILNLVNSAWVSVDVSATQIAFELRGTHWNPINQAAKANSVNISTVLHSQNGLVKSTCPDLIFLLSVKSSSFQQLCHYRLTTLETNACWKTKM